MLKSKHGGGKDPLHDHLYLSFYTRYDEFHFTLNIWYFVIHVSYVDQFD